MLLLNGDCIEEMQKLIDDGVQVDSVVTDPPYHLTSITERYGKEGSAPPQDYNQSGVYKRTSTGFMGKEWDGGDIAFRKETWELALKLLKPGGHLLAFSASRNYHRMAVAIEDAGFEIRDQIMWIYGSGFPKSLNIGKAIDKKLGNKRESLGMYDPRSLQDGANRTERAIGNQQVANYESSMVERTKGNSEWEGWGTALKPAHEPIVMARKALSESSIVDNVLKHGTGGINIDGCRIEGEVNRPPTNPSFRDVAKEALARGGLDKLSFGQDRDRPIERKKVIRKSRNENGVWTNENSGMKAEGTQYADADPKGRFPANVMHDGLETEWAKFFYCPKTSKSERNSGDKNTHPTVKPIKLMKYLCRLVTPKGGTVLDPFMGSGSTGMAAKDEGFDFIGIEKEKEYFEISESRINRFAPLANFM